MKPRQTKQDPQKDLFRPQLIDIINPNHALVRLAKVLDWDRLDTELGTHFATVGAAALPTRLMVGLLYLQHLYNLSDEMVLEQWLESSSYLQYLLDHIAQADTLETLETLLPWNMSKVGSISRTD